MSRTGIICTIGPASTDASTIRAMIAAGMAVARFNFSHGTHQEHSLRLQTVRRQARLHRKRVLSLQDLAGYRIRIGRLARPEGYELRTGMTLEMTNRPVMGDSRVIPFDYSGPLTTIRPGRRIFIDDGRIELLVKRSGKNALLTEVISGAVLKERKGVNIPDAPLEFEGFTEKDAEDLEFAIREKVDWVAQSFVRHEQDLIEIRRRLDVMHPKCKLIAKIESREGLRNLSRIMRIADGVMVARGDLGVSVPIHEVPVIQKEVLHSCAAAGRFTITATQMLESMTQNPRPTRAEVSDVANAILDGTDYVMLSGETAAGKYPVETVDMMHKVVLFTERAQKKLQVIRCSRRG